MKRIIYIGYIIFLLSGLGELSAQTGIISPDGVYVPHFTTANRNAITTPANGQLIYNTDDNCFNVYQNGAWQKLIGFQTPLFDTWIIKANFPGASRSNGVTFSIGNKGYFGTGTQNFGHADPMSDFWEYDPISDSWTQKADYGAGVRTKAVGFSIGSKGYIGTGAGDPSNEKNFWEYDPLTNIWTQKADFGGSGRVGAAGFSIGNKGYIGTGNGGGQNINDFMEYDPLTNSWTPKAIFGGGKRISPISFSIGNKGYIGSGGGDYSFWEYDPITDTWTKKAMLNALYRGGGVAFAIGSKGYFGTGYGTVPSQIPHEDDIVTFDSFYEYDPATDVWSQKTNFGGGKRTSAFAFSIGNKGYVGGGTYIEGTLLDGYTFTYKSDFWEYDPNAVPKDVTLQGNIFNGPNQLLQLGASLNIDGNKTVNGDVNIDGKIVQEISHAASLLNNWSDYDIYTYSTARYYKDKESRVYLNGTIRSGTATSGTVLFNLAAGYRPSEIMVFGVTNGSAVLGRVDVFPNGDVKIISGGNTFLSLDKISFRVD